VVCAETTVVAQRAVTIAAINQNRMFFHALPYEPLLELYASEFNSAWRRNA
jgi:hypothetical protein